VALVTVVRSQGSTPQRAGAKMLVWARWQDGRHHRRGCYENDAFWKAREAISSGKQQLLHFELNDDFAQENGLICGGRMDMHIDPLAPSPRLFIIGAGHVGFHLAKIASDVGFRINVVDDRDKFANLERFLAPTSWSSRFPTGCTGRKSRPRLTSLSLRAVIRTISTRCARWQRAT
jgi:xanthine dehydrogenase accessory factor